MGREGESGVQGGERRREKERKKDESVEMIIV
jgi:hypothetical protein